jgi:nitrous oxide reductase
MTDNDPRREATPDGHSRRGFLALAGAGAAGAALATAGPAIAAGATDTTKTAAPARSDGPLVAHVRDARTGEIAVMVGEREVVVHDRALAARLARIAR